MNTSARISPAQALEIILIETMTIAEAAECLGVAKSTIGVSTWKGTTPVRTVTLGRAVRLYRDDIVLTVALFDDGDVTLNDEGNHGLVVMVTRRSSMLLGAWA